MVWSSLEGGPHYFFSLNQFCCVTLVNFGTLITSEWSKRCFRKAVSDFRIISPGAVCPFLVQFWFG